MEAPMTLGEFDRRLADMVDRHGNTDRDLETYLAALLRLVESHDREEPSGELLLSLLEQAFASTPATYQTDWSGLEEFVHAAPPYDADDRADWNDAHNAWEQSAAHREEIRSAAYLARLLKRYVHDLHELGRAGKLEKIWGGLDGASGKRWNNFHVVTVIRTAVECGNDPDHGKRTDIHWGVVAELLEVGTEYE